MKNCSLLGTVLSPLKKTRLPRFLLTIFAFFGLAYITPAQAEGVLDKKITIVVEQKEVKEVLSEISKLGEIKFVYSAQRIPSRKKVSILANEKRVRDVLDQLLEPLDVLYYVSGNQVVLMKKGEEEQIVSKLKDQSDARLITREVFFKPISGKVTNDKGEPLQGVSVTVLGTTRGTTTNSNGTFVIDAEEGETLEFSMVGFGTYTAKVGASNTITVSLQPDVTSLGELVVIGYGTQSRRNLTTAVSSINNKTLNELPVPNLAQALQGRMAGVSVVNNGTPGSQPIVRIRGISSINSSGDPLYVVDGVPTGDISSFDMRDIETIDVLKDASAAAIYGSRATNGVIIITTKKGKRDGKVRVGLNSYYGIQRVTKRLDLLDRDGFMQYALAYRGSQVPRLDQYFNDPIYPGATQTYGQTNTNWQEEYFRDGPIGETNIDLSGGNQVSRFSLSAGYIDQKGTAPTVAFKRYNFRVTSEHNISKVFTFGQSLIASNSIQKGDANSGGTRSNLVNVIRMMPHIPVHDPTSIGGYRGVISSLDGGDPTNPIEDAELKNPTENTTVKILGNAYLEINIARGLKFRSTFGVDHASGRFYRFQPIFNDNGNVNGSISNIATVTDNRNVSTVLLYTQQLTYDKKFGKHSINATGVFESQEQKTRSLNGSGNQPSNDIRVLQNATNPSTSSTFGENFLVSVLGRINYDYAGKYMVSAAFRRDGLSVWAPGHKWGNFPAASIGWKISEEDFMQNVKFISDLKLRAGYGVTGINGVFLGNTPWLVNVSGNSSSYPFNNVPSPNGGLGSGINSLGNVDLEWELTKQLNIGVDLAVLNNKVTLTADYFRRKTDNLILNVQTPPSFGYINRGVRQNVGSMENNGFEFLLGYRDRAGDLGWDASFNATFIKNKVLSLAPGITNLPAGADAADYGGWDVTNTAPGYPIQYFWGFIVDGIFQSKAEVDASPAQNNPAPGTSYDPKKHTSPGDLKFRDLNKDGVIDGNDRTYLGSYLPKMSYGFNLSLDYKNFDLGLFFQGVYGNKIYNNTRVITEGMIRFFNAGKEVLNAWTPTNTNTNIPRAVEGDPNGNARTSTRFLEDGSYLRLKNISVGYKIPSTVLSSLTKGTVSSFRVYISGQNLLTFTKYKGFDPEVGNRTGNNLTNSIDWAIYPQPKTVQAGIQVNF
jgi:TonB-linked SusC/RagA family outer membrane protein